MLQNVWDDRYRQIPRLEAEEAMRLATIAAYPHAGKASAKMWDAWKALADGASSAVKSMRSQVEAVRDMFKRHGGGLG